MKLIKIMGLFILSLLVGCASISKEIKNSNAGINGGFEFEEHGLPVNWMMYTPETVREGDFQIVLDKTVKREGRQSLKFEVNQCSNIGGWLSPGFCQEYPAKPNSKYKVKFWIKTDGCKFDFEGRAVTEKTAKRLFILERSESIPDWKKYEFELVIPSEFDKLRIELNILSPGSFWIDDISNEKLNDY